MFLIIFNIFTILICFIAMVVSFIKEDSYKALFMLFLCFMNAIFLKNNIEKYRHKDEPQVHVVTNIVKYQVDSTTIINGADTTKTYVLTYWD